MQRPRVLIDAHMVGERETGNETYVVHLVRALRSLGADLDLLVAVAHREEAEAKLGGFDAGVRPVPVSPSPWIRLGLDLPAAARREKVGLLHVTYAGPFGAGCPLVVTIHDVSYRVNPAWLSARDRWVLSVGIGLTARRAARVITVSNHARDEIVRELGLSPDRVAVTYEAASGAYGLLAPEQIEAFDFGARGIRRPYLLAVGNLQPRKNLQRLVEAFASVAGRTGLPHQLVLVGKAQWRESELFACVQRLGLASRVVFTGYVPDEALAALYNAAEVFAYPSLYEGFGLPVLEAFACGAPVITSRVASLPEVAGDAALLVNPHDVGELAAALEDVLTRPERRRALRERGLRRAAAFSWRATAEGTLAAYEAVLRARRA